MNCEKKKIKKSRENKKTKYLCHPVLTRNTTLKRFRMRYARYYAAQKEAAYYYTCVIVIMPPRCRLTVTGSSVARADDVRFCFRRFSVFQKRSPCYSRTAFFFFPIPVPSEITLWYTTTQVSAIIFQWRSR
jgi:hypothetical protein